MQSAVPGKGTVPDDEAWSRHIEKQLVIVLSRDVDDLHHCATFVLSVRPVLEELDRCAPQVLSVLRKIVMINGAHPHSIPSLTKH